MGKKIKKDREKDEEPVTIVKKDEKFDKNDFLSQYVDLLEDQDRARIGPPAESLAWSGRESSADVPSFWPAFPAPERLQ